MFKQTSSCFRFNSELLSITKLTVSLYQTYEIQGKLPLMILSSAGGSNYTPALSLFVPYCKNSTITHWF